MMSKYTLIILLFISVFTSCKGIRHTHLQEALRTSNCNQNYSRLTATTKSVDPLQLHEADSLLLKKISFNSLNVAHAIGIREPLQRYVASMESRKSEPSLEHRIETLELVSAMHRRIQTASLEILATASEMDCEEERAEQIANYLKDKEDNAESKLTVGAIVVGAAGAILTGALLNRGNTAEYIGIATGITEASLGLLILANKRKVEFYHPRNAIRAVWQGDNTAGIFPPALWYYLNYTNPAAPDTNSIRDQIKDKWTSLGQLADVDSSKGNELLEKLLSNGARYNAEELSKRADMHDQLESHIDLMLQALRNLSIELEELAL